MSELDKRVNKLESVQNRVLANQEIILEERAERKLEFKEFRDTLVKINKSVDNLVTESKGGSGYFKKIDDLEDDVDEISLQIAKNTTTQVKIFAFVFTAGIILGWIVNKLGDYYIKESNRHEQGLMFIRPENTKIENYKTYKA